MWMFSSLLFQYLLCCIFQSFVEGEDGIKAEVDYMVENSNSSIVLNRFHGDKDNPVSTSRYTYKVRFILSCYMY